MLNYYHFKWQIVFHAESTQIFKPIGAAYAALNYHSRRERNTWVKRSPSSLPPSIHAHHFPCNDRFSPILSKLQSRREKNRSAVEVKGHYTLYGLKNTRQAGIIAARFSDLSQFLIIFLANMGRFCWEFLFPVRLTGAEHWITKRLVSKVYSFLGRAISKL